jgi:hypothetical protein
LPRYIKSPGFLLLAFPCIAAGQYINGSVVEATSGRPMPGVVLTAYDSARALRGRLLIDERGRFAIADSSVRILQFRRIGFAPIDTVVGRSSISAIQIRMRAVPVPLQAVTVTNTNLCPRGTASPEGFRLWEVIRDGLLASSVSRGRLPISTELITHSSPLDLESVPMRLSIQAVKLESGIAAFQLPVSVKELVDEGYLARSEASRRYVAPTEDVLSDESFAETHCLTINDSRLANGLVGLAFRPVRGRGKVDIQGVIWVTRSPVELRSVDFTYTGLPRALSRGNPGGVVSFAPMPTGATMLIGWRIKSVVAMQPGDSRPPGANVWSKTAGTYSGLTETGVLIARIQWDNTTVWTNSLNAFRGVVREAGGGAPAPDLTVRLFSTPHATRTAADGSFRFDGLIAGRYVLEARQTELEGTGISRMTLVAIDVSAEATETTIEIEPAERLLRRLCRGRESEVRFATRNASLSAAVIVLDSTQSARSSATYSLRLERNSAAGAIDLTGAFDANGRAVICGLPPGTLIGVVEAGSSGHRITRTIGEPSRVEVIRIPR